MVIISFSVLEDKILAGTKTRTMRPAVYAGKENTKWGRVYAKWNYPLPIQISIPLQVYWMSRSKNGHKMFDAVLVNITKKKLRDVTEEEWRLDGFESDPNLLCETAQKRGLRWFSTTYKIPIENPNLTKLGFPDYYNPALLDFEVFIIEFRRVSP